MKKNLQRDREPAARSAHQPLAFTTAHLPVLIRILVLSLVISCGAAQETPNRGSEKVVTIPLGDTQRLTDLYSYTPSSTETLADTVTHYLTQSLKRDGFDAATAHVVQNDTEYQAVITGESPSLDGYAALLPTFLDNGELASEAVAALEKAGKWHDDWRMFLPLGLPMVNQKSVQLLHFPPDYSLTDQDYLNSKTSKRWEQLLEQNGAPPDNVALYETIVDIAPIAAPADQGSLIDAAPFVTYANKQLALLARILPGAIHTVPVVAYGSPVRKWIKSVYKTDLSVLDTAFIDIVADHPTPVLQANHPSYFWYAWDDSVEKGVSVMIQDLAAACWQVTLAADPDTTTPLGKVVDDCKSKWTNRPMDVCIAVEMQGCDKSASEAEALCKDTPTSPPPCPDPDATDAPQPEDPIEAATAMFETAVAPYLPALKKQGKLDGTQVTALTTQLGVDIDTLMMLLLPIAQTFAVPAISSFPVGAVVRGMPRDGQGEALYMGGNVEFQHQALAYVVHAEQSAVNNAWIHGEPGLQSIAVSSPPCGHCRQFLLELDTAALLEVLLPDKKTGFSKTRLDRFLPDPFGPSDLDQKGALMKPTLPKKLTLVTQKKPDTLITAARRAAEASYSPYTNGFAGCAVETADHEIYTGRYAENAAYNPSLPAMASALASMYAKNRASNPNIIRAALVEVMGKSGQRAASENILAAIAPKVRLEYAAAKIAAE